MMLLLPLMAHAEAVEIDGIYYNLINKVKQAEVTTNPNGYKGNIVIPSSIVYNDVIYSVTSIGGGAFQYCRDLTSVTIPNSVTSIGGGAFYDCSGLTSVTIPSSVTSIGRSAFWGCQRVTDVFITDLDAWCKIDFTDPTSNPFIYEHYTHHLYINGKEIKELVIPNSVTTIGNYTFYGFSGLTSITIPNSVTSIGNDAFWNCSGLTSVTIPNSVTSIGNYAFHGCSCLTSVTIPNSVTSFGYGVFRDCSCLTSITIPNSVTSIGESSFSGCSELTSITIPIAVMSIGFSAFEGCSCLTSVTIPNSVTSIEGYTFYGCSGLTSVTIPNSVMSIEDHAFKGCSGLTSVTIGSSVKQIYAQAFANCLELTDVYCYAENVPSTNIDAFNGSLIEYATLHVPASALNAYSNTEPWSNFKYKVAMGEVKPNYTLTYMLDGTKYREYNVQEGEAITPVLAPTKEGFTFSGWSEIPETMPDHDVTITGTFIENTYLPGDANGDGQITVTDIGVIVDIILGKTPANARKQQEVEPE